MKFGKLDPNVIPILEESQIIEVTGWTPDELDRQDAFRIRAYRVVWGAMGASTRKEKKEMNKLV